MRGVNLYIGTTGTGKTHAALEDLRTYSQPERKVTILDLGGSPLLRDLTQFPTWTRYVPETVEEYDRVLDRAYREGNQSILIDDGAALPSRNLPKLCRLWRARNLRILITTQHVSGDIDQAVMACDPLIFAFRTTSPRSLEWLRKWHGIEAWEIGDLELGDAIEISF